MRLGSITALIILVHASAFAGDSPVEIGGRKQLFIDQRFIAHSENVRLQLNPAQKLGPILDDHGERISGHISRVIEDQGKIRLYVGHNGVEVFESDDGTRFHDTGVSLGNGEFGTIFVDPHEPDPARRYKFFWLQFGQPFDPEKHGVYAGYSSDGKSFTTVGRVLPLYTDNPTIVNWDERIGKYVIYTRALDYNSENQRRIARIETEDPLKPWPYKVTERKGPFFSTENATVVLSADDKDDPHSDIYYSAATFYPWAQDVYLMFTSQFRHFSPQKHSFIRPPHPGQWEDFGFLEAQLAVSRDGIAWQRPVREPYFPAGLATEWDRWYTVMGPGIVRRGDYLYQYYSASGRTHDGAIVRSEYEKVATTLGGIGAIRQRLDGFISADTDVKGGWLETPAVVFKGKRLRLNIDTGGMGTAFVELRDNDSKPIEGFALDQCEEIGGNYIDQTVYWKGNPDVSSLAGKPVRIYFKLTRAKLFSFVFAEE